MDNGFQAQFVQLATEDATGAADWRLVRGDRRSTDNNFSYIDLRSIARSGNIVRFSTIFVQEADAQAARYGKTLHEAK
jgi:hypothetical protein